MTENKKWPDPPKINFDIPELPDKYTCFGMEFIVKDGLPYLNDEEEYKDLNTKEIKYLIKQSTQTFKKILNNYGNTKEIDKLLEELKDIHFIINDKINKAKFEEIRINLKKRIVYQNNYDDKGSD